VEQRSCTRIVGDRIGVPSPGAVPAAHRVTAIFGAPFSIRRGTRANEGAAERGAGVSQEDGHSYTSFGGPVRVRAARRRSRRAWRCPRREAAPTKKALNPLGIT